MSGPRVVIVGPPGAGKSTVARLLGERLGLAVRDTDDDVERAAGETISDIFVEHGEARFRALESRAVQEAVAEHDGVLALGGGAVLDPGVAELLAGLTVVFLDVSIKAAAPRVGLNRDRPLLLGNPRAQWIRLMEARRPTYEAISSHRVDTDDKSADEVADEVLRVIT
ncbi:MAG: shikimate kinase [Actinomycetota bacterium]|jgi:shikimate kinase|nr:shikimate kinase [Actinomycetota bacterium]MDQ1643657.1 shikimate kinase [Actinomycetota bacterium]